MTTDKNNSIIKISSDELVQYKNKIKSIAIYNEEFYESEVVELINEDNAGFGTLVLKAEATTDKKGLILSPDWINGNARADVAYTWQALAPDGYTDLIKNEDKNISLDNEQNKLTIIDQTQLASAITITVIAYKQNIFVAQSTPYTVFEKGVAPTIAIDEENNQWIIDGELTGVQVTGDPGHTPVITVGVNGNWFVDGKDTNQKAQGEKGKDGDIVEYVYYRAIEEQTNLSAPSYDSNNELTSGWTESPQGITSTYKYEYMSQRIKTNEIWGSFSKPIIWSCWGDKGQDGDGVSYEYYLKNDETPPTYNASDEKWTDEPTGVSKDNRYEYVVQIKTTTGEDGKTKVDVSNAALWAKWSEDGNNGATPYIGEDDYWYINGVSLGIKAKGEDGEDGVTPTVSINDDGYWVINGTTTDVSAQATNYTNLLLSASSQTFINNPNNNDPITPSSITLTAHLYGDLVGKEDEIVWKKNGVIIPNTTGTSYIVNNDVFDDTASVEYSVSIDDYDDEFTIYLLTEGLNGTDGAPGEKGDPGDNAISAFLTDASISFSADKDGYVTAGIEKVTTVKIFNGATEVSGVKITEVTAQSGFTYDYTTDIDTLKITTDYSQLGSKNSCDGQITITAQATINGIVKTFTLGLSWDKINTGATGAQGLQGLQGIQGEQGIPGENGTSSYFHIKYSENENGNPMTENPSTYIGTYVDNVAEDSGDYTKYTWSRFEGIPGTQGIPGNDGIDGKTSYLHIAYANSSDGSEGFDIVNSVGKLYIGQYTDFTQEDSEDPTKYKWTLIKGDDGYTPIKGIDYFDGTDGADGTSIVWKGNFDSAPGNPENGWAYYNTQSKASYVYQSGSWYQMSIDGVDGQDGNDGISIVWKGELSSAPSNPQINWVYKDTDDGKVYIYNGNAWELMVLDGSDGQDGTDGVDGLSVFITYNDSITNPGAPTGNGTSNGWHTNATSTSIWMSQKVAENADSGTWGAPIKIKGETGPQGNDGLGVKPVNTRIRTQSLSWWRAHGLPSNTDKNWTTDAGQGYVNTHLNIGDTAYISGIATYGDGLTMNVVLYGKVENVTEATDTANGAVVLASLYLIEGGEKGDPGNNGSGITTEAEVYQLSDINGETLTDGNWKIKDELGIFPNDGRDYLWRCLKQTWNDGNITFTTPILLSDYEMGTLFAQIEGLTIAEWCERYDRTLINGSTIATGTITAKQINTEGLSAEYIQSNNYTLGEETEGLSFTPVDGGYAVAWDQVTSITDVIIPSIYMGSPVVEIQAGAFSNSPIETLVISSAVKKLNQNSLQGLSSLKVLYLPYLGASIDEPKNLTFLTQSLLTNLNKIVIFGGAEIEDYAFYQRASLTEIVLPSTLKIINTNVFMGCTNLKTLKFMGTEDQWNSIQGIDSLTFDTDVEIIKNHIEKVPYIKALRGFKISSLDSEPMINSLGFQLTQEGDITANSGEIAGWDISKDSISKDNVGLTCGSTKIPSIANPGSDSNLRFFAGNNELIESVTVYIAGGEVIVDDNGYHTEFSATITIPDLYTVSMATIVSNNILYGGTVLYISWKTPLVNNELKTIRIEGSAPSDCAIAFGDITVEYVYTSSMYPNKVMILEDGSLHASAAKISGTIDASEGNIGNLKVLNGGLAYENDYSLNRTGLTLNNINSSIKVGTLSIYRDNVGNAYLKTTGTLKIIGENNASISLSMGGAEDVIDLQFALYAKNMGNNQHIIQIRELNNQAVFYDVEFNIKYDTIINGELKSGDLLHFEIAEGEYVSNTQTLTIYASSDMMDQLYFNNKRGFFVYLNSSYDHFSDGNPPVLNDTSEYFAEETQSRAQQLIKIHGDLDVSGSITHGSDRNLKNTIFDISNSYDKMFDNLRPVTYRYNENPNKIHTGFIAQEVEGAMASADLVQDDFAGLIKPSTVGNNEFYKLDYTEFIALCVDQIQKLKKRVEELEQRLL